MKPSTTSGNLHSQQILEALAIRWLLIGLALVFIVVVAYWVGTAQKTWLYLCAGFAVLMLVTTGLRQRAWLLVLVGWSFGGNTEILPIPLSVRDMTVLLGTCAYLGYRALSKRDMHLKLHVLDVLVAINVAYFATTFIHHPVGFRALGSETVGGRPYLNVFIAVLAYWVIVRLPDSVKTVSRIPYFVLAGAALISLLHLVAYIFPSLTPRLYFFYSGLDLDVYFAGFEGHESLTRLKGLANVGFPLILTLCAYYPPRTLIDPRRGRFYALMLGLACLLASGFRGTFLRAIVAFVLGSWLHRGWRELMLATVLGATLLAVVVTGQGRLYRLPTPAQRTLSFLPGQWSEAAAADAESSSKWRFDLWRTVIRDRLINDWWFGDGFGISMTDLLSMGRYGQYESDAIMTGAYHSGPLTAIRYAGIVGMVLFYVLLIALAIYSYRCVQQCRATVLQPVAIYMALNLMWEPIHYTFIFGGYNGGVPEYIFYAALLRLVIRMSAEVRTPARAKAPSGPVLPQPAPVRLPA